MLKLDLKFFKMLLLPLLVRFTVSTPMSAGPGFALGMPWLRLVAWAHSPLLCVVLCCLVFHHLNFPQNM